MTRKLILWLAVGFVLGSCSSAPNSPKPSLYEGLDENMERRLLIRFDEEMQRIDGSGFLYEDRELEQYVNAVAGKLRLPSASDPAISVKVIKNPELNAFAFANGRVYIHTGLLAAMENEAQLAAVLGHEIAHISNRHSAKKVTKEKVRSESKTTLNSWFGSFGEVLGSHAIMVSVKGYSREFEADADREGLSRMVRAGYDPREAPKMYQLLIQDADKTKKVRLVYSDHPRVQDRIKNCENTITAEYRGKTGAVPADEYRRRTLPLLLDTAELVLKMGDFAVAERIVVKQMKWKPGDGRAYFLLGEVARGKDEPEGDAKALAYYQKAVAVRRNYAEPYRAMGMMAYKKGDKEQALRNLEQYLSLKPAADDREYIKQYINESR